MYVQTIEPVASVNLDLVEAIQVIQGQDRAGELAGSWAVTAETMSGSSYILGLANSREEGHDLVAAVLALGHEQQVSAEQALARACRPSPPRPPDPPQGASSFPPAPGKLSEAELRALEAAAEVSAGPGRWPSAGWFEQDPRQPAPPADVVETAQARVDRLLSDAPALELER